MTVGVIIFSAFILTHSLHSARAARRRSAVSQVKQPDELLTPKWLRLGFDAMPRALGPCQTDRRDARLAPTKPDVSSEPTAFAGNCATAEALQGLSHWLASMFSLAPVSAGPALEVEN